MAKMGNRDRSKMRLTIEQRIAELERDNVVLHDTIKLLHKLLKEERQLINDYITQKVASVDRMDGQKEHLRPDDELYTFRCRKRFERLEKRMEKMNKSASDRTPELKAGSEN